MNFENAAFTIFAIVIGLGLGAAGLAFWQTARKRLERLSPAFELGTCRTIGPFGSAIEGLYKGYTCRYSIQYASQYDPGGARLRINATSNTQWSAEPANTGSKLLVKFGLAKDYEIGDRVLDERFRFTAEDEGVLQTIFGTESARDAMHTLAATENFKSVGAREERIDFQWAPRNRHIDEETESLRFRLESAISLAIACNLMPRFGN